MTNTYNADNLRTTKTVGNTTTEYVWDGQNLVSETKQGTTDTYTYDIDGRTYKKAWKHGNIISQGLSRKCHRHCRQHRQTYRRNSNNRNNSQRI